jgi:short-subunit dehydrogenase
MALLEDVASTIRTIGGQALVVTADVSSPEAMNKLAEAAVSRFGRLDVWINNAGVGAIGRFEDIPMQDHARIIDVNLKGVIYGSHVAMRQFRQQGYGTLVNIGSLESEIPLAYQASYAASKAGVLSLGRALNEEIRLTGMEESMAVATVLPWAIDTPFFQHAANYSGHEPRMIAKDDPQKVIDAVIWMSLYPREELPVGWKAIGGYIAHRIAPDISETIAGSLCHQVQMVNEPPARPSSGNLYQPMYGMGMVEGKMGSRTD